MCLYFKSKCMNIFRNFENLKYKNICIWGGGNLSSPWCTHLAINKIWSPQPLSTPSTTRLLNTCRQSLLDIHVRVYRTHLVMFGNQSYNLLVTDTDYIGWCKPNYHTIEDTMASRYHNIFPYRKNNILENL